MALQACNECGSSVSSKAASCPRCGNPIAGPGMSVQASSAGRRGKIAGFLLILIGMFIAIAGNPLGGLVCFAGFAVFVWARFKD